MTIGFVGLGAMGYPMAQRLLAAGHTLQVWARRPAAAGGLPVLRAASPVELARNCAIVCTNVTGSADVDSLALQMIDGFSPGAIHVDFSTIAPSLARHVAQRYAQRGIHFVDAPVSGGTRGAREGRLAIMWGGAGMLAPRLAPLFACLGQTVVRIGEAGAGQVAKACNQLTLVAAIAATAEAARLAQASGIDFGQVRQALLAGSAASRALDVFGQKMQMRDFSAGVEARLHHKDLLTLLAEAAAQNLPLPLAGTLMQALHALMAAGWGKDDTARLLCVLERASPTSGA